MIFKIIFAFFKQKTAYEILRSDWSSDVCSSDPTVVGVLPLVVSPVIHNVTVTKILVDRKSVV